MNTNLFSPGLHKLIHHQEHLSKIKAGCAVGPIHVSIWPTNRCQLNCPYCCFKNREVEPRELPLLDFKRAINSMCKYGLRALEFSGGGEPLMWSHFEAAAIYAYSKGLKLSLITNGLLLPYLSQEVLNLFSWVRVSIQSDKYAEKIAWGHVPEGVRISASYIVNNHDCLKEVRAIHTFAVGRGIVVRVSPKRPCSLKEEKAVSDKVAWLGDPLVFFGKPAGTPAGCYMPWVRAAIDWNGNFITCTSPEMTPEAGANIPQEHELCKVENLEKWLQDNRPRDMGHRCSFCNCGKDINDYIHKLMQKVEDVDFV